MLPALTSAKATTTHHHVRLDNRNSNNNNNTNSSHNNNNNNNSTSNGNSNNNSATNNNKRNASMIFRIEHLIPTSVQSVTPAMALIAPTTCASSSSSGSGNGNGRSTTAAATAMAMAAAAAAAAAAASTATNQSSALENHKRTKLQRCGVYVSQHIPKDTLSEAIATHALIAAATTLETQQQAATRTYCTLSQRVLCMTPSILRKIKLAEDIPSYNALFELHGGHVRVRIIRDIARDDEIVAWFGDEVTMLMAIPFLTPLNIQGNNRYTCHLCQLTFETPNPLKIHLSLACGRHSMDILWIRLHYAVRAAAAAAAVSSACQQTHHSMLPMPLGLPPPPQSPSTHSSQPTQPSHSLRLSLSAAQHSPNQPSRGSMASSDCSPSPPPPFPRFSAFKPITPTSLSPHAPPSLPAASLPSSTMSLSLPPPSHATTHSFSTSSGSNTTSTLSFLPSISSAGLAPAMSLLPPPPQQGVNPLNAAAQIEAIVSNMGASKQGHLCIYCGKVYSRKYGLKIHIRTHTGFKPLKCKFCLRPFGDPSNLNKHVRLHLQAGPSSSAAGNFTSVEGFKCHLCHKTLARRRDLQRHIESRHSSIPTGPNTHTVT